MAGRSATVWLLLTCLVLAGCQPTGPQRFQLSGNITFAGSPVPAGTIVFEPDASQGNDGPQGVAPIVNGQFDTARGGKGTIGGPHRVTILGCDGVNISEVSPQGKLLFEPFITSADLPRERGEMHFDVPGKSGSAASR